MTITPALDYSTLTIESEVIDAFIDDPGTLTIEVTYNCGTAVEAELAAEDLDGSTYVLTPEFMSQTGDAFSDGVYYVYLKHLLGDTLIEDTRVYYIGQEVNCKLIEYYADWSIDCLNSLPCDKNFYFWPFVFHYLLNRSNSCQEFTYTKACKLWTTMNTMLDETDIDCGCH